MLGSIEATFRRDAQLAGPQLRYWAPSASGGGGGGDGGLAQRCAGAGLAPLEPSFFADRPLERRQLQPWPLLRALADVGVHCAAVLSFSTEGDNAADALQLATAAAAVAGLAPAAGTAGQQQQQQAVQWVPPASWQYVYGGPPAVY